jgi:uncharacterized BrkB/YihY/UPF0761 family membrane protein
VLPACAQGHEAKIDATEQWEKGREVRWRLVLWGVVLGVPIAFWLAHGGEPSRDFTRAWVWTLRGLVVIAVGIEIMKWANRKQG